MARSAMVGAALTIGLAIPAAGLVALVYRFPVPFAGYLGGLRAVVPAMFGALMYVLFGGFIVLGVTGAIAGLVRRRHESDPPDVKTIAIRAAMIAIAAAFAMSVLDKLIGPW